MCRADGWEMLFEIFSFRSSVRGGARAIRSQTPARAGLVAVALLAALLLPSAPARAADPYQNPFAGEQYFVGRTDMGVDLCLTAGEPIRAVGAGVVVGVERDWFEHEPYIWYELTSGPDAGRYVYVAEQIDHLAQAGQTLQAGDVLARYAKKGSCIETGWSTADGQTLAAATTGYTEGEVTVAGVSFAHFLIAVGVQGQFELVAAKPQTARVKRPGKKHKRPSQG
jgi:hypothetical protein